MELASELDELHRLKESYWHARARANELRDGDKNTKYFHHKASQRKKRNTIHGLLDTNGVWKSENADIGAVVEEYFTGLFMSSNPSDFEAALEGVRAVVTADMNDVLDEAGGGGENGAISNAPKYDRVEWSFLERVMGRLGFGGNWIRRVMNCLSSVSFTFKINGGLTGSVIPSRGLRQGDPISPYFFLLCADAFSLMIAKAARVKLLHGVKICNGAPQVSHLFFADDSILFAKATLQECSRVADIISKYERASGQKVNLSKTEVAFSKGVPDIRRKEIVEALGVREVDKHENLGCLPLWASRRRLCLLA